jgi:selenide,water dikinase
VAVAEQKNGVPAGGDGRGEDRADVARGGAVPCGNGARAFGNGVGAFGGGVAAFGGGVAPFGGGVVLAREQLSPHCGCAAKLGGTELTRILEAAAVSSSLAAGNFTVRPEDCAIIEPTALPILATLDYGPLVTASAYRSGRIAAVHALSDTFAMGGRPLAALAMLTVDLELPRDVPRDLLAGMIAGCAAEGVELLGGHTVIGPEAMVGLSIIGQAGRRLLTKRGARCGDLVMVSKPLGTGLALRAYRQGLIDDGALEPVLANMEVSNRKASRIAVEAGVHAATDVTGFGLAGHLAEMLAPDGLGARVCLDRVPVLDAAKGLPSVLARSKWIEENHNYCQQLMPLSGIGERDQLAMLLDPQTSGGLLVAASDAQAGQLAQAGFQRIGTVTDRGELEVQR